ERGPSHGRPDLLVTDERGFPVAQLVDLRFPDVVQERSQPGDQLRRSERRGEQRVAEDIMAVPATLLHPLAGLELRPAVRSRTVPSHSISSVLTVKSRRMTSSLRVPGLTFGLRLAGSYRSTRLDTNSNAWPVSMSRWAVPNRSKTTGGCKFNAALTAVASSIAP